MAQTRDLGVIDTQATERSRDPGSVDVLGGLKGIGDDVAEVITDVSIKSMSDDFDDAADEALAKATEPVEEIVLDGPETTGDAEADALLTNIRTLQSGIDQATGSTQQRLQLELRKRADELGQKFPGMRSAIASELKRFVSMDPEVAALHALDVANTASSKEAAAGLAQIKSQAYDSISAGGFGMVPGIHRFGSKEFALEYAHKTGLVEQRNINQLTSQTMQSQSDLNAEDSAANFQSYVIGQSNVVQGMVASARESTDVIAVALQDPTAPGAAASIAAWNDGGRDVTIQGLQSAVFAIEQQFSLIPLSQSNSPRYQGAKALKDQQVGALNTLIEGVTQDNPTIIEAYAAYETMQTIAFEQKNPQFAAEARILKDLAPIIDLISDDFGAQGEILKNDIAGYLNQSLPAVLGRSLGFTRNGQLPANASPEQLANHYREIRTQNPSIYGNGQVDARGVQTNAVTDLELKFRPEYLRMAVEDAISPDFAATQMGAIGSQTEQLRLSGEVPVDAAQSVLDNWAQPGIMDMANTANKSTQNQASLYAATEASNVAFANDADRRANYETLKYGDIGHGLVLWDVVEPDGSNASDGEIVFRVDEDKIKSLIGGSAVRGAQARVSGQRNRDVANATNKARAQAAALSKRATTDLKSRAHIFSILNGEEKANYVRTWDQSQFDSHFGALVQ